MMKLKTTALMMSILLTGTISFGNPTEAAQNRVTVSQQNYSRLFGQEIPKEAQTDPELAENMKRLVYGDIYNQVNLPDRERQLVTIVVLAAHQNKDLLSRNVKAALKIGVTPLEIREAVYQVTPYMGFARTFNALNVINAVFKKNGIKLPLPDQSTVTEENRVEKGFAIRKGIYGNRISQSIANSPPDTMHIQDNLSGFCFGDTYTRGTLDLKTRELLTASVLASLGGLESQLKGHIKGNLTVGNTRETIIAAFTVALPYNGFPRTLNAMRCLNEVTKELDQSGEIAKPLTNTKIPTEQEIISALKSDGGTIFPIGKPNSGVQGSPNDGHFTGTTFATRLAEGSVPVGNVTFTKSAHTHWHIHHGTCQILIAQSGRGYYQIWGQEPQEFLPGQVVTIPADVKHWHGAAPNHMFQHISVREPIEVVTTEWLEPVDEEFYSKLP